MKYTFEDWLNGKIQDIARLHLQHALNQEQGTNEPCLPDDEYQKIIQARKQAFDWAVETTLDSIKHRAENKSDKWKDLEIQEIEKFINENPKLEQEYEAGHKDTKSIDGLQYRRYRESYERFKGGYTVVLRILNIQKDGKAVPSRLQDMYAFKAYLKWLKKIRGKQGRPEDFPKNDTLQWYEELIQNPEYQQRGKPHLTNIQHEIARKHTEKTGVKCNSETIRKQIYALRDQGSL